MPPALVDDNIPNDAFESDAVMPVSATVLCNNDSNDDVDSTLVLPAR